MSQDGIPEHCLKAAQLQEGEEIISVNAKASDEHASVKRMATKVYARLFASGVNPREIDPNQITPLRWGWIKEPSIHDPTQLLSTEPLGRMWVVYTKTPKDAPTKPTTMAIAEKRIVQTVEIDDCACGGILHL